MFGALSRALPFEANGINLSLTEKLQLARMSKEKLPAFIESKIQNMPSETKAGLVNLVDATFYNTDRRAEMLAKSQDPQSAFFTSFVFKNAGYVADKFGFKDKIEAGNTQAAVGGIVILCTLMIGALILIKVKSAAVTAAGNDTDAVSMIGDIWDTGSTGLLILALSVLVLGAIVILGYLMKLG